MSFIESITQRMGVDLTSAEEKKQKNEDHYRQLEFAKRNYYYLRFYYLYLICQNSEKDKIQRAYDELEEFASKVDTNYIVIKHNSLLDNLKKYSIFLNIDISDLSHFDKIWLNKKYARSRSRFSGYNDCLEQFSLELIEQKKLAGSPYKDEYNRPNEIKEQARRDAMTKLVFFEDDGIDHIYRDPFTKKEKNVRKIDVHNTDPSLVESLLIQVANEKGYQYEYGNGDIWVGFTSSEQREDFFAAVIAAGEASREQHGKFFIGDYAESKTENPELENSETNEEAKQITMTIS